MIVDFPKVKNRLYKNVGETVVTYVAAQFPLIRLLGVRRQHEGDVHDYNTTTGEQKRMEYLQHSFGVSFDHSEFETLTADVLVARILTAANQMAASLRQATINTIVAATESTGNIVKTADFGDPENMLRMLSTVPIDFAAGSRAHPQLQMMIDANSLNELNRRFDAMTDEQRADYARRHEEILDQKYAEYLSRENDRKLVD